MKIGIGTLIFLMNTETQPKQDVQSCFDCVRDDDAAGYSERADFFGAGFL